MPRTFVPRDIIRMISGEVLIVEPLKQVETPNEWPEVKQKFYERMKPIMTQDFTVVMVYTRLDSRIDATPAVVINRNISSIMGIEVEFID